MASVRASVATLLPALAAAAFGLAACGDSSSKDTPDAGTSVDAAVDSGSGACDPNTVLPAGYTPVSLVSTGAVTVTVASDVTSGTIDATAGGLGNSADNPYIYVDFKTGTRVDVTDVQARTATNWDISLKRSSLHTNSGDAGAGNRQLAIVNAATLAEVTAAPTTGYTTDDYTTADCKLSMLDGGEPESAFGQWYDYDVDTHVVTPMAKVYVLQRNNGTHVAFRFTTYYGDPNNNTRGAYYGIEWKTLP